MAESEEEVIFTPRGSLRRTPPGNQEQQQSQSQRQNKKRRQEESPVTSPEVKEPTQFYLRVLEEEIEVVMEATSKESGGKISFNKGDQVKVRESVLKIQQMVANMAYRLGILEGQRMRDERERTNGGVERDEHMERMETLRDLRKDIVVSREIEQTIIRTMREQAAVMDDIRELMNKRIRENEEGRKRKITERERVRTGEKRTETGMDIGGCDERTQERTEDAREETRSDTENKEREETADTSEEETWSYAGRVRKGKKREERDRKNTEGKQEWKTPPPLNRNRLEVRVEGKKTRREILDVIKGKMKTSEIGGPVKGIYSIPSGALVLDCETKEQMDLIKGKLQGNEEIKVKGDRTIKPTYMLCGIDQGLDAEKVMDEIFEGNPQIFDRDRDRGDQMRLITRRRCRDQTKENWLMESPAEIFKKVMKRGTLAFDMHKLWVEEHIRPPMCFRCCKYGHLGKNCKEEKEVCYVCAGEHEGRGCKEERVACINCKRDGYERIRHTAKDRECPVLKRKIQWERRLVDFGEEVEATKIQKATDE